MMRLSLASWIAQRYLKSRRAGRFAPMLMATAVASIAVGTMALIVVLSVMRGFRRELTDRLLGFNAHITITQRDRGAELSRDEVLRLLDRAHVRDLAPFVQGEVIAESNSGGELTAQGARVRGVDPEALGAMRRVTFYVPEGGELRQALATPSKGELPGAVVGSEIVSQLLVHPDFGDRIDLVAPLAELSPTGELIPNRMSFRSAGIFRAGVFDYDSKLILVPRASARRLLGEQASEGWQVWLEDAGEVPRTIAQLSAVLPAGWEASGVDSHNRKLFAALALERFAMGGILLMVLSIASCAIAGVVLLLTAAKRKDMAILIAVGLDKKSLRAVFLASAAQIGALGSLAGLAAGLFACGAIERWPIRLPASYYLEFLPVEIDPLTASLFAAAGIVVAVLAALWPVRGAAQVDPVEVLRYE
jgi:lipoprotein-releasing system permease protein